MIDEAYIIRFSPDDVPDLPELRKAAPKGVRKRPRRVIPEPEGWSPLGGVW